MARRRNPRGDDELQRLRRAAAQGDPQADARLRYEDEVRRGATTPPARQLAMGRTLSPETRALLQDMVEQYLWNTLDNWGDQREYAPIRDMNNERAMAMAVTAVDASWRRDFRSDEEFTTEWADMVHYDHDDPCYLIGCVMPTRVEGLAVLEAFMPLARRRELLAGLWNELTPEQQWSWRQQFPPSVLAYLG